MDTMKISISGSSQGFNTVAFLSTWEIEKRFGIRCCGPSGEDGISFKAGKWKPGGEYIHKFVIKNISTSVRKLKYKLPRTRFFSMGYPEVIILSPGMSKEIDVVFRPIEYEPYDDSIYVKLLEGPGSSGFHFPCRAFIEKLIVTVPFGLDLGFCPVNQKTSNSFVMKNVGEIDAPFEWESCVPFVLSPSKGIIAMGKSLEITVSIYPEAANVFVSQASCKLGEGVGAIIETPFLTTKLSAICKHAFISLSESEVDFGELLSRTPADKTKKLVLLRNSSIVPAEFQIIRLDDDIDEVFDISPRSGVVPEKGEIVVTVKYRALAVGVYSLDRYEFRTPADCCAILTCKGMSMPARVKLVREAKSLPVAEAGVVNNDSTGAISVTTANDIESMFPEGAPANSVNFRDIEVGEIATRVVILKNDSDREVDFSIVGTGPYDVFHIEPMIGRIPSRTQYFPLRLSFTPGYPINFYRRIFLLLNGSFPLFCDLLGSGFIRAYGEIKEKRPAPLRHAHIQAYRNRAVEGLGGVDPDSLDELALTRGIGASVNGSTIQSQNGNMGSFSGLLNRTSGREIDTFFAHVGLQGTTALSVAAIRYPLTRSGDSDKAVVAAAHEFFIDDADDSEAARKYITIDKTGLDFGFTPYGGNSEAQFVSISNGSQAKVTVDWVAPVPIKHGKNNNNNGNVPNPADFEVFPQTAEIPAKEKFVFRVVFHPNQSNRNFVAELQAYVYFKSQRTFRLVNDHSLTPPWPLSITTVGHTFSSGQLVANARFASSAIRGHKLVFPVCFVRDSVFETIIIRNTSNLPCVYKLSFSSSKASEYPPNPPNSNKQSRGGRNHRNRSENAESMSSTLLVSSDGAFSVKPAAGEVAAEGVAIICVKFSPSLIGKKYSAILSSMVNGDRGPDLALEGTGDVPSVVFPDLVDLDFANDKKRLRKLHRVEGLPGALLGDFYLKPTCVGLSTTRVLRLRNPSRLPLRYVISLPKSAQEVISVTPLSGLLKGNEQRDVSISFAPMQATTYEFHLQVRCYPVCGQSPTVVDARQVGKADTPELLQYVKINIIAHAQLGALLFQPRDLVFDVLLANQTSTQDIFIQNVSETDLKFKLFYKVWFVPSTGNSAAAATLVSDRLQSFFRDDKDAGYGQVVLVDETNNVGDSMDTRPPLFCDFPEGKIDARSTKKVSLTFSPSYAGSFSFSIFAHIQAVDGGTGLPLVVSNEEMVLLRATNRNPTEETLSLIKDGKVDISSAGKEYLTSISNLPVSATVTAIAAFPVLIVEDIRSFRDALISDVAYLWKRFSILQLNRDLCAPPTSQELMLFAESTPDKSRFRRYEFAFTPAVLGSPTQTLFLSLKNIGLLGTTFEFHWPNEKELDLEMWCDEEVPSVEGNRVLSIIEELKCFSFEPSSVFLAPGESALLTVSYDYSHLKYEGIHKVPLLARISQGKTFYIDLVGRTIPAYSIPRDKMKSGARTISPPKLTQTDGSILTPKSGASGYSVPSTAGGRAQSDGPGAGGISGTALQSLQNVLLLLPGAGNESTVPLQPVPISLSADESPRQLIEITNASSVDCEYEIDLSQVDKVLTENYNRPIIHFTNPSGLIPAYSSSLLEVFFCPIEAKEYSFPIVITYKAHELPSLKRFNFDDAVVRDSLKNEGGYEDSEATSGGSSPSSALSRKKTIGIVGVVNLRRKTQRWKKRSSSNSGDAGPSPTKRYTLSVSITALGYNPRGPRPLPNGFDVRSGIPPVVPALAIPECFFSLSVDCIAFGVVPQNCRADSMTVLRNSHVSYAMEFYVEEMSCHLATEGYLSVSPTSGTVGPRQAVVFNITLNANTPPICFDTRMKIVTRAVAPPESRKRPNTNSRLLDRLTQGKGLSRGERQNLVLKETLNSQVYMDEAVVPLGRSAKLPSSVDSRGVITQSPNRGSMATFRNDELVSAFDTSTAKPLSTSQGHLAMTPMAHSPKGLANPQHTEDLLEEMSISRQTRGRQSGGQGDGEGDNYSLLSRGAGPTGDGSIAPVPSQEPTVLIMRLQGEVYTEDSLTSPELEGGEMKGVTAYFVRPRDAPFVPPASHTAAVLAAAAEKARLSTVPTILESMEELSESLSHQSLRGGDGGAGAGKGLPDFSRDHDTSTQPTSQLLANKVIGSSRQNDRLFTGLNQQDAGKLSLGSRSSSRPGSSSSYRQQMTSALSPRPVSCVAKTVPALPNQQRQMELRDIGEFVLFDLFRSVTGSAAVREYASAVLADALRMRPSNAYLRFAQNGTWERNDLGRIGLPPVVGQRPYPLYFQEALPQPTMHERLIRELKYLGYKNADLKASSALGVGTGRLDSVGANIPAAWTLSKDAIISDASHFALTKRDTVKAFVELGMSAKGNVMKEAYKRLSAVSDESLVYIANLLGSLTIPSLGLLEKKVDRLYFLRTARRRDRAEDKEEDNKIGDAAAQVSLSVWGTGEGGVAAATDMTTAADSDIAVASSEVKKEDQAAAKIQRLARIKSIPTIELLKEDVDDEHGDFFVPDFNKALEPSDFEHEAFIDTAAEVLRNTFFNLIQEAVHEEFSIDAEPVKFLMKK